MGAKRGLSLVEVMVVAALFATVTLFFAMIQLAVTRQSRKTSADTEVQDALAMTVESLKRDLRGARLVSWSGNELSYRTPVLDNQDRILPGSTGVMQFVPVSPDRYTVRLDSADGWLKRYGVAGDPPRRLGRLGQGGFAVASQGSSGDLLTLSFTCVLAGRQRQSQLSVYFGNQP